MNLKRLVWNSRVLSDEKRMEWYPPFWMMRIKVLEISDSWRTIRICLPHNWVSTNLGGGMFGGFQASLADPIAALACAHVFPGHSVWTRALELDFQHEGSTDLELKFTFPKELEEKINRDLSEKSRSTPTFEYGYHISDGTICTTIKNTVAIRPRGYKKKDPAWPDLIEF